MRIRNIIGKLLNYWFIKAGATAIALSVALIAILPAGVGAAEVKGKTYNVGANVMYGAVKTGSGYVGLTCDYLNSLSKYTGDNYNYIEGSTDELFEKLKNGDIDIIPCVTELERQYYEEKFAGDKDLFKITGTAMLSRFSAVFVYDKGKHSDIVLNDVGTVRQMNIGYLLEDEDTYFINGRFAFDEIGGAKFTSYNTEATMREDFVSGKIDAVVKDCLRPWSEETIAYKFGANPGYFVVRADDAELSASIESGLRQLFMDFPTFYGDTYQRNISNFGSLKFAHTAAEAAYKKKHSEITLGFNTASDTMNSYNKKTQSLEGVVGSLVDRISETTGLKVNVSAYSNREELFAALHNNEVDFAYGDIMSEDSLWRHGFYITASAVSSPIVLAGRADAQFNDYFKVGVYENDDDSALALQHLFPKCKITYSRSAKDACEDAMDKVLDVACLNSYDAMYLRNHGFKDLSILKVLPVYSEECFALRSEDTALCKIIENALIEINGSNLIADVYNMTQAAEYSAVSRDSNTWLYIIGLAVLAALATGVVMLIILENKRRSEVDRLTGGMTKQTFIKRSQKLIKKSGSLKWTLILIDIDRFKFINDRLGYEEGDRMLERVFKTIECRLEKGETLSRIADDNFACCIRGASENDITNRLNDIFEEFERRNKLFVSYPVVFSAGVCKLEDCTDKFGNMDFNAAVDRCNIAKKTIKGVHSHAVAFYDGKIRERALQEKDYENAMPEALEQHEFQCYIQPKYATRSRKIAGGEALIRWNSAKYGFVYPDQFIPIAEKNGFVIELDFFILEEVCRAIRRWIDAGIEPVVISVNQSRMHMAHGDYIWRLREIVDKYNVPYEYVELEITETTFTDDAETLLTIMEKLHEIGFQLSIDDFGSGYSSLNMLKDIPADVVKIDREFFNGTVNSDKGRAVISTVVDLAKKLDMHVISEGVETLSQVEFLDKIRCDLIQGYYFAKPMPLKDFEKLWFKELEESGKMPKSNPDSAQNK